MFGCCSCAAARASRRNFSVSSRLSCPLRGIFTATMRSSFVSLAFHTEPNVPVPRCSSNSNSAIVRRCGRCRRRRPAFPGRRPAIRPLRRPPGRCRCRRRDTSVRPAAGCRRSRWANGNADNAGAAPATTAATARWRLARTRCRPPPPRSATGRCGRPRPGNAAAIRRPWARRRVRPGCGIRPPATRPRRPKGVGVFTARNAEGGRQQPDSQ